MNTEHTNKSRQAEPATHSPIALQSIPKRQRDFTAENIRDIAHECMRIGDNEQAEVIFAIADALRDGNLTIHPAAVAVRIRELEAQLNAATHARQEAQQIAQEAIEARNRAGVEIRRPLLKRIRELQAQHGELLSWMTHIQGAALDMSTPRQAIHLATVNAIAAAAQAQAEPVNQQLLALVKSFGHKTGCAKNAFGEQCTCGVDEAIAAAEQVTLCTSCARANVDCPIYPQQTTICVEHRAKPPAVAVPSGWASVPQRVKDDIAALLEDTARDAEHSDQAAGINADCELASACKLLVAMLAAAPQAAGAVPDEGEAFKAWFDAEQSKPYEYMWDFARAAWNARAVLAAAPQDPRQAFAEHHLGKPFAATPQAAVSATDSTVGKLRLLVAACNRIEEEAEEFEGPDGLEMGIAMDYWHEFAEALTTARKALAAAPQATAEESSVVQAGVAVPGGYKLVPIKPTDLMLDAAVNAGDEPGSDYYTIYAAMLAAAPQAAAIESEQWPKERDVGRIGDMSQVASLRVGLDADSDVYVCIHGEAGSGSVEFCVPSSGGGKSPRTRKALIALMVAMEADNAETPSRDWWKAREGDAQKGGAA